MSDAITGFVDEFAFLSNFAPSPIVIESIRYPTAEHAYQAAKVPPAAREGLAAIVDPGETKRHVRSAYGDPDDWGSRRVDAMRLVLEAKFDQNPHLADALAATDSRELIEDNWWGDTFWGRVDGVGENTLGLLLMQIRTSLVR